MLEMNLKTLLEGKGIENPQRYLVAGGLPYYTVSRLFNNKIQNVTYATLEKLCLICNCTLDELFVWTPTEEQANANIALQKLKAKPAKPSPVERIKNLPLEKLEQLQQFIDGLEKG